MEKKIFDLKDSLVRGDKGTRKKSEVYLELALSINSLYKISVKPDYYRESSWIFIMTSPSRNL